MRTTTPTTTKPMKNTDWLGIAQRLQALAHTGLTFAESHFDQERYQEIQDLSLHMMANLTGEPVESLGVLFAAERNYPTPKVDVRAVLFRGTDEVLMVQEKMDGYRWTLPGGWADIGYTPFEIAVKEAWEETGLEVKAVRLLALLDKKMHAHPPQPWYVYKAFVLCQKVGGQLQADTSETAAVRWVHESELPGLELSTDRTTLSQLKQMFEFARHPDLPALCD
jgi:ADP-ribose pyrophosphatase YjhB (NUDIX family)